MNETQKVIHNRRSIRAYSDRPITREEKDQILSAAMRAPTAGNLMLYSIIEVEDQSIKERLAVTCDNQPFIAKAPYVLLFIADYQRWHDYFESCGVPERSQALGTKQRSPQMGDLLLACCDALIAAQTSVLAAESLGIGSCYIGDILEQYEIHRELFSLPPFTIPITLLCFGYPTVTAANRRMTTRFPQKAIVHVNRYNRLTSIGLNDCFGELEKNFKSIPRGGNFDNAGQEVYFRKFAADFSLELNRSVKKMIENWT